MNVSQNAAPLINVDTTRFGGLTVAEDRVIHFVCGIPGFDRLKRFILIDHDPKGVFKWLQSIDDPAVAFLMTDPVPYMPGYRVPLKKNEVKGLGVLNEQDLVVLVMVCVSRNEGEKGGKGGEVSLNLKGPVVFNSSNMRAIQCVIDRDEYPASFVIKS